jgi:hypothetical protein
LCVLVGFCVCFGGCLLCVAKRRKFQILFPQKDYYSQIILHRDHEQLHNALLVIIICLFVPWRAR